MRNLLIAFLLLVSGLRAHQAHALINDDTEPVLYFAEEQTYDSDLSVLILRGNVEFLHKGDVLEADYVTYSETADIVTASGNVRLRRSDGDVFFGKYLELTGDMKEGFIRQVKVLMKDDARVVAAEGRRLPNRHEFDQAVYTPCMICGPGDTPTWQLNSSRVVKDDEAKRYYFTDATMQFLGVPVMYFPLIYHPTERQSGLLTPLFGRTDKDQGLFYAQPLYIVLSREDDLTLTPVIFTKENPLGIARYRRAFSFGAFSIEGSLITPKSTSVTKRVGKARFRRSVPHHRGHVLAAGEFSITEAIRLRAKGGWVSDDTFFKKFPFFGHETDSSLNSEAVLEGFWDQDYAALKIQHFQSLVTTIKQDQVADALPYAEYHSVSGKDPLGGRLYFDSNFLNLTRESGRSMQRGTGVFGWRVPTILPCGQLLSLFAEGHSHIYKVDRADSPKIEQPGDDGTHYRLFPKAGAEVRWPFVTRFMNNMTVLEPIGQIIVSSKGLNPKSIPNEDSIGFEFSDTSLFARDRPPGEDMVDEGSRTNYGLQMISRGTTFGDWEVFGGQSFNFNDPDKNLSYKLQGLSHRSSHYVGRVNTTPIPGWLKFNYKGRFARDNLENRFSKIGGSLGPKELRTTADYIFVSKKSGAPNMTDFKQVTFGVSSQFLENWTAKFDSRYDFSRDATGRKTPRGGKLSQSIELAYHDDCFTIQGGVARTFYRDRDVKPGTAVMVSVTFKNLGQFGHKFNLTKTSQTGERNEGRGVL